MWEEAILSLCSEIASHIVVQVSIKIMILLPHPPGWWDIGVEYQAQRRVTT